MRETALWPLCVGKGRVSGKQILKFIKNLNKFIYAGNQPLLLTDVRVLNAEAFSACPQVTAVSRGKLNISVIAIAVYFINGEYVRSIKAL